ncbi:MAG TPA: sterol carrier protein domain-containing protein, partial [Candidatus Limnocylindrales bacterium]
AELIATNADAETALWHHAFSVDLVSTIKADNRRLDEPIVWRLADARAARLTLRADLLWLRPLDAARLLEARRYQVEGEIAIEVVDPAGFTGGRFVVDGGPDGARCRPTDRSPALRLPVEALGSLLLGGVSLSLLATARRLDVLDAGVLPAADSFLRWPVAPWCTTWF